MIMLYKEASIRNAVKLPKYVQNFELHVILKLD